MARKKSRSTVQFQLVDIDYEVRTDNYRPLSPIVILYGRKLDGDAVTVHVTDFFPYLYMELPDGATGTTHECNVVARDLNRNLKETFAGEARGQPWRKQYGQQRMHDIYIKSVEAVTRCNVYGYQQPRTFLKVTTYSPKDVPTIRNALWERKWGRQYRKQTYECDFLFVLRFLVDKHIRGAGWIEFDTDQVQSAHYVVAAPSVRAVDLAQAAPLRILSFDLEVSGRPGIFPEAEHDAIIQIANYETVHGAPIDQAYGTPTPRSYKIFQWKPYDKETFVSDPPGAEVVLCRNESDMLTRWAHYVQQQDPDFITGVSCSWLS